MPRRNSPRTNEGVRRAHEGGDGAKLMAKLGRDRSRTPAVGRAMQDARRRAGLDA